MYFNIWNFILRAHIALDFYNYFYGNDALLTDQFKEFISFLYQKKTRGKWQQLKPVFNDLQDTWQDLDFVISLFFYKCNNNQIFEKDSLYKKAKNLVKNNKNLPSLDEIKIRPVP